MKFRVGLCAELFHILQISEHYNSVLIKEIWFFKNILILGVTSQLVS
jgi:hypothetical protein